jgi:hypothetical protein
MITTRENRPFIQRLHSFIPFFTIGNPEEIHTLYGRIEKPEGSRQLFKAAIRNIFFHIKVKAATARRLLMHFVVLQVRSIRPLDIAGICFYPAVHIIN